MKPRNIFLLDALGALLTTLLLFIVLRHFNTYFGMPDDVLVYLSLIAFVFFIYSACCFLLVKNKWKSFLAGIAGANIFYCILTLALVITHASTLTAPGFVYFIGEAVVIGALVFMEIKTIRSSGTF